MLSIDAGSIILSSFTEPRFLSRQNDDTVLVICQELVDLVCWLDDKTSFHFSSLSISACSYATLWVLDSTRPLESKDELHTPSGCGIVVLQSWGLVSFLMSHCWNRMHLTLSSLTLPSRNTWSFLVTEPSVACCVKTNIKHVSSNDNKLNVKSFITRVYD